LELNKNYSYAIGDNKVIICNSNVINGNGHVFSVTEFPYLPIEKSF